MAWKGLRARHIGRWVALSVHGPREPAETLQWNRHHPGPSVLPATLLCWEGGDCIREGGLLWGLSQACSSVLPPEALLQFSLILGPRGPHSQHRGPPGDPSWPPGWLPVRQERPLWDGGGAPRDPNVSGACSELGAVGWEGLFQQGNREGSPDLEGRAGFESALEVQRCPALGGAFRP